MNTSLKKYIENNNNIYDIIGKSNNKIPDDKKNIYAIIAKYVQNPTKIHFVNMSAVYSAIKKIDELRKRKIKPFFTGCIFCLAGKKCGNHAQNRFFSVNFKYGKTPIKLDICYPDISKCRTRVTFGFHIDFDFTYNGRQLKISGGRTYVPTPRKSRYKGPQRLKNVVKKQPKPVFDTRNFPDLSISSNDTNDTNDKIDNGAWTTIGNDAGLLAKLNKKKEIKKQVMIHDEISEADKKNIERERQKLIIFLDVLKKEQLCKKDRVNLLETTLQKYISERRVFNNPEYFNDDFSGNYSIR